MIETDFVEDANAKSVSFYATNENISVTKDLIKELVKRGNGKNARLSLHASAEDGFHQMLILEYKGASFPAHRHPSKAEGYHIIEGEMLLILYSNEGARLTAIKIDKDHPIARVGPSTFHRLVILSDYAIYHETKPGPFVRDSDKVIPEWA